MKRVIFDWKRTLYDPDRKTLINGTFDLLEFLKHERIPMVLIGKGNNDMHEEVSRLEVKEYFTDIIFHEGVKNMSLFSSFVNKNEPNETVFIGDRVRSELLLGKRLGATTIWVRQGKFAIEDPEDESQSPTYTVHSLAEVKQIVEKFQLHYSLHKFGKSK